MYRLGITGSIGSGKTTVSRRLEALGATLSISDDLAKQILFSDEEVKAALVERFGSELLSEQGKIIAQNLANTAFRNPESQKFLNNLIHPKVRQRTLEKMKTAGESGVDLFVVDAPLIFEAGVNEILDGVAVVIANDDLRQERVLQRSGITADDFKNRDGLQIPQAEKAQRADFLIENNGTLEELESKADELFKQIMTQ